MWIRGRSFFVNIAALVTIFVFLTGCAGPGPLTRPGKEPGADPGEVRMEDWSGSRQEPTITLYNNDTGRVESVRLETYLQGVVAGEMETNWPQEALAAQSILARTFTVKKIQEGGVKKHGTDASTDVEEFQAYMPEKINKRVKDAVAKTRGQVVTYQGKYINGWFHACSGGKTAASAVEGLDFKKEKAPYIKSVSDPGFCQSPEENKSWIAVFPLSEVRQKVQDWVGQDPGAIEEIRILEKGPSGRATKIKVGDITLSGPSLRLAMGSTVMRSALFTKLEIQGGRLIAEGQGYGHGVGLSQWGAKALAEEGHSAEEIVRYFFRDVEIQRAWD